ncbi:hypothetical protein [Sphingomonas oryzagri]
MLILALDPIVAIAILASISLVLFLAGEYLVGRRMAGGPVFGIAWAIITIVPVFGGIPFFLLRGG